MVFFIIYRIYSIYTIYRAYSCNSLGGGGLHRSLDQEGIRFEASESELHRKHPVISFLSFYHHVHNM